MQKNCSKFCLVQSFGKPLPTPWSQIVELMKSEKVNDICETIKSLDPSQVDYQSAKSELKKKLPAITVHSCYFEGAKRTNDAAWYNGIAALEWDHLTEEEVNAFKHVTPTDNIVLAGLSCSGSGVWFLIEVPNHDYSLMEATMQHVYQSFCSQIKSKFGLDVKDKVDIQLDTARLRFLPPYSYIWYDNVQDFACEKERQQGFNSQYAPIIEACSKLNPNIPVGQRHDVYGEYVSQISLLTDNKHVLLRCIPDLGLPEQERMGWINWAEGKIQVTNKLNVPQRHLSKPIDHEALPYPKAAAPKLINTLVKQLPHEWQQSAAICLLPSLSVACGQLNYANGKPLAFQVALFGQSQTGKTEFTCAPARFVQDYIDTYDPMVENSQNILGFQTSTVQLCKDLAHTNKTVMLYEDELSSVVGADKGCSFLGIQPLLRVGFDGNTHVMNYKTADSFRGKIKCRLSFLCCGTPKPVLKYFGPQSTEEGNTRRVLLVEHVMLRKHVDYVKYTEEEQQFIHQELDWLQGLEEQTLYNDRIEQAARAWKHKKQQEAGEDDILYVAANTPCEIFKRGAYLAWTLNHFDSKTIKNCIKFGLWLAEYQYRSYLNNTYETQKTEMAEWKKIKAPSTQDEQEGFNKKLFADLPQVFTMKDVVNYRISNNYQYDPYNQALLNRWRKVGKIVPTINHAWMKV